MGMWSESSGLIGVGYEGQDIDTFLQKLEARGVDAVVDVRLNAISRKKGFSKKALCAALNRAGIGYRHMPVLGNPKSNRDGFWKPGTDEARSSHDNYRRLLREELRSNAIDELVNASLSVRVAVLCFEAREQCCHRSLVIEAVEGRIAKLQLA
jgi:uncharacterized protein (DUF488 family)